MPLSGTPRSPPSGCGLHLTFNSCPVRVPFGPTEAAVCTTPWPLDTLHPAKPGLAFPGHQRSYGSDPFRSCRDDSCLQVGRRPVGWWVVFGCPARRGSHGALGLTLPPLRPPRAVAPHLFCVGGQHSAVGTDGVTFAPGPRAVACGGHRQRATQLLRGLTHSPAAAATQGLDVPSLQREPGRSKGSALPGGLGVRGAWAPPSR